MRVPSSSRHPPPIPSGDFGGNHDYEVVDEGEAVHIQSALFDGVEDPDMDAEDVVY